MRRRGEVVSKIEILQHVWDPHYDGDPNVVEVYVGYLRRKIDAPFGRRAIADRARRRLPAGRRRWLTRRWSSVDRTARVVRHGDGVDRARSAAGARPAPPDGRAAPTGVCAPADGRRHRAARRRDRRRRGAAGGHRIAHAAGRGRRRRAAARPRGRPRWSTADRLPDPVPRGGEGTAAIQVVDARPGAGRVHRAPTGWCRCCRPAEVAAVRAGQRWSCPAPGSGCPARCGWSGRRPGRPSDPQTVIVAVDFGETRSGTRVLLVGLADRRAAAAGGGGAGDAGW